MQLVLLALLLLLLRLTMSGPLEHYYYSSSAGGSTSFLALQPLTSAGAAHSVWSCYIYTHTTSCCSSSYGNSSIQYTYRLLSIQSTAVQ
jgi:hypothetical protein